MTKKSDYENIIESFSDGLIYAGLDRRVEVFNQNAERITELSRERVLGEDAKEAFKRNSFLSDALEKTLNEDKLFVEAEFILQRHISQPIPISISTSQVFDVEGRLCGAAAIVKDVSLKKSFEDESLRKERLAYIGTFAANLAHEVRNPLGGIKGAAQLLSKKLKVTPFSKGGLGGIKEKALEEYTGIIIRETERLNSIVNDMLNFTRQGSLRKKPFNLHKLLDRVIGLIEDKGFLISREYDPSLPEITGDEDQLSQVFLNLLKNAKEAVAGKKGSVVVTTRMATDFRLMEDGTKEAKFVEAWVEDNGCGIKTSDMERIFTPFFTTKRGGSGLGLGISYRIIKEHNGFLKMESETEKFTRARVFLPIGE
ncbi:MAG: ATP-binding protein [Thermodesulfobacteriota bacterium]